MKTWLLEQLNLPKEFIGNLGEVRVTFENPVLLVVGLALLVPVAVFVYLRQRVNMPTAPAGLVWALTAVRMLVLVLLVAILGNPHANLDVRKEHKPVVAVLLDHSQSMTLPAGPFESEDELKRIADAAGYRSESSRPDADVRRSLNKMSRAKLAHTVIQSSGKEFFESLAKDYDVRYWSFARDTTALGVDPRAVKLDEPPVPGGASTQIGDAITKVLDDAAGRQVAGLIVFSDGQNNAGRTPSDAAAAAGGAGSPVFAVPVGSAKRQQDVAIVDVFATTPVTVEDTVRIAVTVESSGFDKRPVKVELRDGQELLDSKDLTLRDSEQQQIELTFKATKPGARYLTVSVPVQPEELDHLKANNSDVVFVRVSEEKLKVLYVEGRPHWDFRFLKNALRRDNGIAGRTKKEVDLVLETEWRRLPKEEQAKALPRKLDELAEYHVVVIGDVSPRLLDPGFVDLLDKAVREKGVGLVVQAGPLQMPHKHPDKLADLLPVRLQKGVPGRYPRGIPSFRLELAPEGSIHEAMRFFDEPGRNQTTWANLPRYYWAAASERASPGATVLCYNPVETAYGKSPLIAHHYAGQGRVLFVGTDETFRWRQNVGERFFYRFWGQGVRFVARREVKGGKKSWIEVRPLRAQPGEQAEIELFAFDQDGKAVTAPKLLADVIGGGKKSPPLEVHADPLTPGRYVGKFTPASAGEYTVRFTPPGDKAEAVEARLRVASAAEEMRLPNVNRPALEQMAGTSGGAVVELWDLKSIAERLKGDSKYSEYQYPPVSLWRNWPVLILLIFLYSLDVGLRRLRGLS